MIAMHTTIANVGAAFSVEEDYTISMEYRV